MAAPAPAQRRPPLQLAIENAQRVRLGHMPSPGAWRGCGRCAPRRGADAFSVCCGTSMQQAVGCEVAMNASWWQATSMPCSRPHLTCRRPFSWPCRSAWCSLQPTHFGCCNAAALVPGLLAYPSQELFESGVNIEELCRCAPAVVPGFGSVMAGLRWLGGASAWRPAMRATPTAEHCALRRTHTLSPQGAGRAGRPPGA